SLVERRAGNKRGSRIGEDLDPIVKGIGDINIISSAVNTDTSRVVKLAGIATENSPLGYEISVGIELLNAVIATVADVDISFVVNSNSSRQAEWTKGSAQLAQISSRIVEFLNAVVVGVGDVHIALRIHRDR